MLGWKRMFPIINEVLQIVRLYHGYNQKEMSKLLNTSQAMISDIERGKKSVSIDMLNRYSVTLGIRKSQLLFLAEELDGEQPIRRGNLVVSEKALKLLNELEKERNKNV